MRNDRMGPYLKALILLIMLSYPCTGDVITLRIDGAITPASDDLVKAAIGYAESSNADALIMMLDTPGGGLSETLEIIAAVERTEIPVVGYVSPPGAKAWSAGTMILISTDIAAMAPNTIIGSAQPVRLLPTGATEP
ncbi:MAG: nodulation protein NfeD, partial [Methanothrix sp.]